MNLSGDFVGAITHFYKITTDDIFIVSDDVDTPLGSLRIKKNGSSGGQNGIKDIVNKLGTEDIKRIKIGIGRPSNRNIDLASYVLSPFTHEERNIIDQVINQATNALMDYMNGSTIEQITIKYNK
jgi:PTH1 family peptidyl-tRNA hydrolase